MKVFTHFIITRFNIPVWWSSEGNKTDWINHRFRLFDRYCFPSILNQTNNNFKWLVIFKESIDKNKIEKYSECKQFVPVFANFFDLDLEDINHTKHTGDILLEKSQDEIKKLISKERSDYIITTRLDSDDLVSPDFVSVIQQNFRKRNEILNIPHGYILYKNHIFHESAYQNPFMTMVEENKNISTVYGVPHWKANNFMKLRQISKDRRLWAQVIHTKNFVNQHKIKGLDRPEQIDFNIKLHPLFL